METKWYMALVLLLTLTCNQSDNAPEPQSLMPDYVFETSLNIPPRIIINSISTENGSFSVDFQMLDVDDEQANITVFAWHKADQRYVDISAEVSGDVGNGVTTGDEKTVNWMVDAQFDRLKIEAVNDLPPKSEMKASNHT